jgi:dsDNA-specific endonuclease/ATPase MutS2
MSERTGAKRAWRAGDAVQTPFGKGVVREVRSNGRLLVQVHERALLLDTRTVSTPQPSRRADAPAPVTEARPSRSPDTASPRIQTVVDLHGLTVEAALTRVEQALDAAILADLPELRFIHGRSGGRIRAALHRQLGGIPTVRRFFVDPRNDGVTIVEV